MLTQLRELHPERLGRGGMELSERLPHAGLDGLHGRARQANAGLLAEQDPFSALDEGGKAIFVQVVDPREPVEVDAGGRALEQRA